MWKPAPALFALLAAACDTPEKEASSLEQRSREQASSTPAPVPPATPASPAPAQATPPPPDTERVPLQLTLAAGSEYVVHTVGMVQLPLMGAPTGFAREERTRIGPCNDGASPRTCQLTQRSVKYEAEGQAGKILEGDEARVSRVALRSTIDMHGKPSGDASLEGEPAATASAEAKVLLETHPFYCLRFPTEPVGVGAKWNDTCKRRVGGVVGTRDVVWELAKLEPGAPETGRRAELSYVGRYTEPTPDGKERRGTVQGAVFFLVDRGEPYMIREQITVDVDPANALRTLTQLNHTFMHPREGKPGKDGKPREELILTTGDAAPTGINAPKPPASEGAPAKGAAPKKP